MQKVDTQNIETYYSIICYNCSHFFVSVFMYCSHKIVTIHIPQITCFLVAQVVNLCLRFEPL